MPLFEYHAVNINRAFLLNAIASGFVIIIALYIKGHFDIYRDNKGNVVTHHTTLKSIGLTFLAAVLSSLLAFYLLHFITGFGGGMLSSD